LTITKREGQEMKITCVCCSGEVNLDHQIFENYAGPIKCFRCGAMMEAKTEEGKLCSLVLSPSEDKGPKKKLSEQRAYAGSKAK